jgi:hypothetical protein
MKITKRQLRTIIKEEKSRLLNENLDQRLYAKLDKAYQSLANLQRTLAMAPRGVPRYIDQALADIEGQLLDAIDHMDKNV